MNPPLLHLPPNRVRRNYRGGAGLDRLEGRAHPADGEYPENWIASLVEARNPGLPARPDEGLATVAIGGESVLLRDLVQTDPTFYLGHTHVRKWGTETGFLAKLLDSAMRLHIQAHPTREFATAHYGKPWGKFETYVILAVRPECEPFIYLGFQHPPSPEEWLRIVVEQDLPAMEACFDKIPVAVGEVWYVPGGLPHALGAGLTVLEVMEPSDLVVRCEFEREGIVVPEPARFMGQAPAEALRIFDFSAWPYEALRAQFQVTPRVLNASEHGRELLLIGPQQIDCFEVRKLEVADQIQLAADGRFRIGIVHAGYGSVSAQGVELQLQPGSAFFVPAATQQLDFHNAAQAHMEIYFCLPGT